MRLPMRQTTPTLYHEKAVTVPKIFDCCLLFQELDILETRFHILNDVVDHFVVCESAETHSGRPKPYHLSENWSRFSEWHDKIIYIQVADLTHRYGLADRNSWERERYQRFHLRYGLKDAAPNDYVIVADCDEIPRPEAIQFISGLNYEGAILEMDMYYYDLNHRVHQGWSIGMCKRKTFDDPNDFRTANGRMFPHFEDSGWHFSYFGGAQSIVQKVSSFMHHADPVIRDMPRNADWVAQKVAKNEDLFDRGGMKIEKVPITPSLPRYILDNLDHYRELGWLE